MTADDVRRRLEHVQLLSNEGLTRGAWDAQLLLYVDLMHAIATDNCEDPRACCALALYGKGGRTDLDRMPPPTGPAKTD